MAYETTAQKLRRMFKPEVLEKFEKAGLAIVDKDDLEITIKTYNDAITENKALKLQVRMQKARIEQLQQKPLDL